jgi:transcriptional pleiotropic regulator of transition state genes
MKATGIVRKVDELGRIVLPKELRDTLDIDIKDPIEIFTENDTIILRKYQPACGYADQIKRIRNNIAGDPYMCDGAKKGDPFRDQ